MSAAKYGVEQSSLAKVLFLFSYLGNLAATIIYGVVCLVVFFLFPLFLAYILAGYFFYKYELYLSANLFNDYLFLYEK